MGRFRIAECIGQGSPLGTVFRSRLPVGIWPDRLPADVDPSSDLVLTRILWLDGLEQNNATAYARYIYIHGTNWENRLGSPASCGCVRMANRDMAELFDLVDTGDPVTISDAE